MFIDVTRPGGDRVLRVAAAAIAYLDVYEYGTVVHLIGGGTLRVEETPAEIEARANPQVSIATLECRASPTLEEVVAACREVMARASDDRRAEEPLCEQPVAHLEGSDQRKQRSGRGAR